MTIKTITWTPDTSYPAGKGATEQRFTATVGLDKLEIDTHPWGEADLKIKDKLVAHVDGDHSGGDAFRDIETIVEEIEADRKTEPT
ncbi:hypothetical protein GFB49_18610 [Epibacterium sp. SM1979]|uniref:Uncharacterized protein n=1 Tax=Tritonibacter litoralis TaxID=2662264 RepID=A0A843YG50_9RHOB|nr:hypothetical protein [Tritonibacter litoralis]MQQ10480.1 hypothetical protein [Tritonibacter litoralis]